MSPTSLFFKSGLPNDDFQKRKTLLGFYYFLISIGVRVFFAVVNIFNPKGQTDMLVLSLGVLFSVFCLILLRLGWVNTSIIAHLIFSNAIAFRITYQDPDQYLTGSYIYFIPAILWALAIFGYRQRWIGLGFSILSVALFLIAIFEPPKFRFDEAHFYFIMNFVIVMVMGMIILTYYSKQVLLSESALRDKNSELEKTNVELDRFVYSASHDLRSPISSLLGLIQLYRLSPGPEKDSMVTLMESRVRKLDEFVNQIIQYSRNARQEMNLSAFKPFELINGCWERLRFIPQKIQLQFNNKTNPSLLITHDADRLQMIIENLVSSGIKYARVQSEPSFITVHVFEESNYLNIIVADNGIGIVKNKQEKVFDMFYRGHETSDGSGLGLYIVKEMVMKMHGQISMSSDQNKGTEIRITLPLMKGIKPAKEEVRESVLE